MSKEHINLPKTAFSMKANLPNKEPGIIEYWQKINLYEKLRKKSKGKEKFILHDGPPYANGNIHMGTALNKILKDINDDNGPVQYKLILGHSGWTSGQLEKEIENGDWLMQSASSDFVFNTDESLMWQTAANSFGVELSQIASFGGSA